jgi:hypothetical protein
VLYAGWLYAGDPPASVDDAWTSDYEDDPDNTDPLSKADDHIRSTRNQVRERAEVEHSWGYGFTDSPTDETGRHREGSARAFYGADAPTGLGFGEDPNELTEDIDSTNTLDEGRLWHDTDTGELKITTADPNWVDAVQAFTGDANNQIDLLSGVQFLKAGSDPMDTHDHAARHQLSGSDGAWVDALDGLPFSIQQILTDTTCTTGNLTTDYADKATISPDFTGRTGDTKVLVLATVTLQDAGSTAWRGLAQIILDDTTVLGGEVEYYGVNAGDNNVFDSITLIGYHSGTLDGDAHDFDLQVKETSGESTIAAAGDCQLILIDLGNN